MNKIAKTFRFCFCALLYFFISTSVSAQTTVFINEIHYDNISTDTGEAIEIAGPAGTDLTGWSIVLYNGNGGAPYGSTINLSGTIPSLCSGFGVLDFAIPGLQNGSPDGIALVDNSNTLVQFLSYEGSFTGVGGPADGITSTDIGVSEATNEPVGNSLQLSGTGSVYENFTWNSGAPNTFGNCNTGQTFSGGGEFPPSVANTNPVGDASNVAVDANIEINFSEAVDATGAWFDITGSVSGTHTATVSGGPQNFTLDPDVDFGNGETVEVTIFAAQVTDQDSDDPPDNMAADFSFSFTTASAVTGIVINEIHADPDPTNGDANGDGTVDTSQDEFVEIYNNSGANLDISGWTLSDAVSVKHTFPAGTVLDKDCAVVVFAGGSPTGLFGGALVQTASSGLLGLNNGGDTVTLNNGVTDVATASYGSEGGDNQSLTLDPDITGASFVKHSVATGSGGALFSPGTKISGALFDGCSLPITEVEIYEIQSNGPASPFVGQMILTKNNIVTALRTDGFFIQIPDARADADPETSNGIFVFTNSAPTVAVGDAVDVQGMVQEFFDFTEINGNPTVTVLTSGNPLPAIVTLDGTTPSPDAPQSPNEFERLEGMLIEIVDGVIGGPSQQFSGDPLAEGFIVAGSSRPFREEGIEFPFSIGGLPVWDGNPEVFELDPDKLGLPNQELFGNSTFSASGVMGFEFGGYEFWPTSLSIAPPTLPRPVRERNANEALIATLNMFRFFDDVDDGVGGTPPSASEYADILTKFSKYIREVLRAPEILAVQEVENLNAMQDLANKIKTDDAAIEYTPILIEGNDVGGIDIGFLVRNSVVVNAVTQLGASELFSFDGSLLHDRPPLLLEANLPGGKTVSVLNLHLRSLSGIDDPTDGLRVRQKRDEQATSVSLMIKDILTANPNTNLIVTGDFNAFQFTAGYVHVLGQITGDPADATQALIPGTDNIDPNLINLVSTLDPTEQYSFVFNGSAQVLDHMLVNTVLHPRVNDVQYARGNADAPINFEDDPSTALRASDHDALALYINTLPELPHDFVILAQTNVKFDGTELSDGDIHSNGDITFHDDEEGEHTGNLSARGDITIDEDVTIVGDAIAGDDIYEFGDITGSKDDHATVAAIPLPTLNFTAGGPDKTAPKKGSLTLGFGTYGKVKVEKKATLYLSAGDYFMDELDTDKAAKVVIDVTDGAVSINVVKYLEIDRQVEIVIVPNGQSDSELVTFSSMQKNKIDVGKHARMLGTIIAPLAEVHFSKGSQFKGAICADKVTVEEGVPFFHHSSPHSLPKRVIAPEDLDEEVSSDEYIVDSFELMQNYPNPFNPSTMINYQLPVSSVVNLAIYNMTGQLVRTLVNGEMPAGSHSVVWNATDDTGARVASGVYLYVIRAGEFVSQKKLVLMK